MQDTEIGYWNPVRQTAICELVDRNNKKFQIRALIDGGSDISIVTQHVLFKTNGDWLRTYIPEVNVQGVNSCSTIRSTVDLTIIPSRHLQAHYVSTHELQDVKIKASFHVMSKPDVFFNFRKEYPEELRKKLTSNYELADPILAEPGDQRLNIHAILGVNVIRYLKEQSINIIEPPGVEIRRSVLGDLISGNTHFVEFDDRKELIAMSDQTHRIIL
jgi:hypothetical protein